MHRIELQTSGGDFVAFVEIAPFPPGREPDVVTWGIRTFAKRTRDLYVEAFAVVSVTPSPGLDKTSSHQCTSLDTDGYRCTKNREHDGAHGHFHRQWENAEQFIPPVDRSAVTTLHGSTPEQVRAQHSLQPTGQHPDYIVLTEAERAKGLVRPVRRSYKHVGIPAPKHPLIDLTDEQKQRYADRGYAKFEQYPEDSHATGRYWTQREIDSINSGCGAITTMGHALAETYARDPHFYGATFCCQCNRHIPVGERGEFVWEGTDERVGT